MTISLLKSQIEQLVEAQELCNRIGNSTFELRKAVKVAKSLQKDLDKLHKIMDDVLPILENSESLSGDDRRKVEAAATFSDSILKPHVATVTLFEATDTQVELLKLLVKGL